MATRYGESEAARARYETWQRGFNRMLIAVLVMVCVSLISVGMAFWAVTSKPEPRYFVAREDGGILPIVALNEPYLTNNQINNFAVEAITRSLTFNFATWRQDLNDASRYFTKPEGYDAFLRTLTESGMRDYVIRNKLITTAVVSGAVVITETGPNDQGIFHWVVQVPLRVTYESASENSSATLLAEMEIVRVPTQEMSEGVGVRRVTVKPGGGNQ